MPIKVTCSNSDCGAVFTVGDEMAGDTVTCPRCSTSVVVKGEAEGDVFEFADDLTGASGTPRSGDDAVRHPSRLTCSACGAVLGVRDAFCPDCGADVRTGQAVAVTAKRKKRNLKPIIIAAVVVVVAAVLVVVLVSRSRKDEEAPGAAARAEQPAQPAPGPAREEEEAPRRPGREARPAMPGRAVVGGRPGAAEPAPPAFEIPAGTLSALQADARTALQAAQAYKERLGGVLASLAGASPGERAALWADLYVFCRDSGLQTEADLCWAQAVRLRPTDDSVNRVLGRTETFNGMPVTPEQKRFLDSLRPRLRLVNHNPDLGEHSVRVQGKDEAPFQHGKAAEYTVDAGPVQVEIVPAGRPDRPTMEFSLDVEGALVYTLEIKKISTAPLFPFDELAGIYAVVTGDVDTEGVVATRDAEGKVIAASAGDLSVSGSPDAPLQMRVSTDGTDLSLVGRAALGNRFADAGQEVVRGSAGRSARLALDASSRTVGVQGGVYYTLRADFAPGLWGVLGTAQGDFASEWARRKLARRVAEIHFENAGMEARGELLGSWQALVRTHEELDGSHQDVEAALQNQDRAAGRPSGLDRARALGLEDRAAGLYVNWPRFRLALSLATAGAEGAAGECLDMMAGVAARPLRPIPTRGRGAGRAGPTAPGRGRTGLPAARQDAADSLEPAALALADDQELRALLSILPVFADDVALQRIRENWPTLDASARSVAMASLEQIGSSDAVAFLGRLSEGADGTEEAALALLSLGVIGTPEALRYCDTLAISPDVRAAAMVARAVGGDPEALAGLPAFLQKADADVRVNFIEFACDRMATPAALLVLSQAIESYQDAEGRALIAKALARTGGHAALGELARLMKASGQAFPEALGMANPAEALLLVEPVGQALASGTGGDAAASLLVENGSAAALAFLQGAAGSGNRAVVERLLEKGSAKTIEAAAAGSQIADLELMRKLRRHWFEIDTSTGQASWRGETEAVAGRYFLERVLAGGADPTVRLAAAALLHEVGQVPDAELLLALAQEDAPSGDDRQRRGTGRGGQYTPPGYQAPEPVSEDPEDLSFEGKTQVFALRLLAKSADASTPGQLRRLAEGYQDAQLKAEALRALGAVAGDGDLQMLRTMASARRETYSDLKEMVAELQDRVAALGALGAAKDVAYLPQVLGMLQETPPEPGSAMGLEGNEEVFKVWWQTILRTGGCQCVAEMCRERPLAVLTGDSMLQAQLVRQLVAIIQELSADRSDLLDDTIELHCAAIRAFGRMASPTAENKRVLERVASAVEPPPARSARSARTAARPTGGVRATARQREAHETALTAALAEATTYMAVRDTEPGELLARLDGLLTSDDQVAAWNTVVRTLSGDPTPALLQLVSAHFDRVRPATRGAILAALSERGPSDPQYAQWLVAMVAGPVRLEAAVAAAEEEATAAGRRASGRDREFMDRMERVAADVRAGDEALLRDGVMMGRPPGLEEEPDAATLAAMAGGRAVRDVRRARAESAYRRTTARRYAEWSYSVGDLADRVAQLRSKWSLVKLLFEADPGVVSRAVEAHKLAESDFGPAIAALYVERNADAGPEIVTQLSEALLQGPSNDTGGLPRLRSLVAALRRIGGEAAADALYLALVGPQTQRTAPVGMPGMAGLFAPGEMGPGAVPGVVGADRSEVAVYIARALGTMGRSDLLQKALDARGHNFFNANALAVQLAVLEGLAYLPVDKDPVRQLEALLRVANTVALRAATARALVRSMRNMAAE